MMIKKNHIYNDDEDEDDDDEYLNVLALLDQEDMAGETFLGQLFAVSPLILRLSLSSVSEESQRQQLCCRQITLF